MSPFEVAKILLKQIKALGISKGGLSLGCSYLPQQDVSVTPEGIDWAKTTEGEGTCRDFGLCSGGDRN